MVTDNIRTPENIGMIFRVSEAFGVKHIILIGDSPDLTNRKVTRTARNTEKELTIETNQSIDNIIPNLKKEGYLLLGLEITKNSKLLKGFNFSTHQKIAVFIGSERSGINNNILKQLDIVLHFNLFGKNSSINVVNALSIGLYELTKS